MTDYDVAAIRNQCGVTHYAGCDCHENRRNEEIESLRTSIHQMRLEHAEEIESLHAVAAALLAKLGEK